MKSFITQIWTKLTPFFVLFVLAVACNDGDDVYSKVRKQTVILASGKEVPVRLAITDKEQSMGLSGIPKSQFPQESGMLFFYLESGNRRFWMPNTYFNLDIFFLDKNLKVVAIERNVQSHPGKDEPPPIPTTGTYWSTHVLEMRADSQLSQTISLGNVLKLKGVTPSQIESEIRRRQ